MGDGALANSATSDALSNTTDLSLGGLSLELNQRVGVVVLQWISNRWKTGPETTYVSGGIDSTNHARLAMVVLVLGAVEGDGIGVLDGHGKGWLAGGLACRAEQESRVERAIGLAGRAAASSSGSDGMILRSSERIDQVNEGLTYSGNPDELDGVTDCSGDGRGGEDSQSTSANLDLVGGSIDGGNASRSSNDRLGEMHGWRIVYIMGSTGELERQLTSWKEVS